VGLDPLPVSHCSIKIQNVTIGSGHSQLNVFTPYELIVRHQSAIDLGIVTWLCVSVSERYNNSFQNSCDLFITTQSVTIIKCDKGRGEKGEVMFNADYFVGSCKTVFFSNCVKMSILKMLIKICALT